MPISLVMVVKFLFLLFIILHKEGAYGLNQRGALKQVFVREDNSSQITAYLIYNDTFRIFREYSRKPNNFQIISKQPSFSIEITFNCDERTCVRNKLTIFRKVEIFKTVSALDEIISPQLEYGARDQPDQNCALRQSGNMLAEMDADKILQAAISQNIIDPESCDSSSKSDIASSLLLFQDTTDVEDCISRSFARVALFKELAHQIKQGAIPFKIACSVGSNNPKRAVLSLPERIMTFAMPQKNKYCLTSSIAHELFHFADPTVLEQNIIEAETCYQKKFPCNKADVGEAGVELALQQANRIFNVNMQSTDVIIPADPKLRGEGADVPRGTPAFGRTIFRYANWLVGNALANVPDGFEGNTTGQPEPNLSVVPRSAGQQPKGSVALLKSGSGQISELRAGQNPNLSVKVSGEMLQPAEGNFKIGSGRSTADEEVLKLRPGSPGLKNIGDARAVNTKTTDPQSIEKSSPQLAIAGRAPASAVSGKQASQIAPDGPPRVALDTGTADRIARQVINDLNSAQTAEGLEQLSVRLAKQGIQLRLNLKNAQLLGKQVIGVAARATYSFVQEEDNKLRLAK